MSFEKAGSQEIFCIYCGSTISVRDEYCPECNHLNDITDWKQFGQGGCGNCFSTLSDNDKYCRICGTLVGDVKYIPYRDFMECIYGPPPVKRSHYCKSCGHSWENELMIDDEQYCPMCGCNDLTVTAEDNDPLPESSLW